MDNCVPRTSIHLGKLRLKLRGVANPVRRHQKRFLRRQSFALQLTHRVADVRFQFLQVLRFNLRRLAQPLEPVPNRDVQVKLGWFSIIL